MVAVIVGFDCSGKYYSSTHITDIDDIVKPGNMKKQYSVHVHSNRSGGSYCTRTQATPNWNQGLASAQWATADDGAEAAVASSRLVEASCEQGGLCAAQVEP